MKPIEFKERNVVYAKDQPEYLSLPAHRMEDGEVITCWKLTLRERLKVLFTGRFWICLLTFNQPLQPVRPDVNKPNYMIKEGTK